MPYSFTSLSAAKTESNCQTSALPFHSEPGFLSTPLGSKQAVDLCASSQMVLFLLEAQASQY